MCDFEEDGMGWDGLNLIKSIATFLRRFSNVFLPFPLLVLKVTHYSAVIVINLTTLPYTHTCTRTVRDLLSPNAEEQHYKSGMRKDPDGFMDIEWCGSTVVNTW